MFFNYQFPFEKLDYSVPNFTPKLSFFGSIWPRLIFSRIREAIFIKISSTLFAVLALVSKNSTPPRDSRIYEQFKKTQFLNNRKRELMKWQTIQEQNTQILARLIKISNRSPTPPSQCGTPRGRRNLKEQKIRIESENKRLHMKICGMQSDLKSERFQESFVKHKQYQQNMQKFYFDPNLQKIKLRVDAFLDNVHSVKLNSRSQSQHHQQNSLRFNNFSFRRYTQQISQSPSK